MQFWNLEAIFDITFSFILYPMHYEVVHNKPNWYDSTSGDHLFPLLL